MLLRVLGSISEALASFLSWLTPRRHQEDIYEPHVTHVDIVDAMRRNGL